jgi:RNA polymerase sigma-70 factor (ECF subfamily)
MMLLFGGRGVTSLLPGTQDRSGKPLTLGDVLYAAPGSILPEEEWASLVRSIAASDQLALHALYHRSHRIIFTLIMRITANRETAEERTIDVFDDIWLHARDYDAADGTVLGWLMNLARSRAVNRARREEDVVAFGKQREALRKALSGLTPQERRAIEATFFDGLPHAEAAMRIDQPLSSVIRSGLHKLRDAARGGAAQDEIGCGWNEVACAYTVHALPADEVETAIAHFTACPNCHREMESLRPLIDGFVAWPTDVLRPRVSLQARVARRIAKGRGAMPDWLSVPRWPEPAWEPVAQGIDCKLLASDKERERISMLVRFAPQTSFGAHTHAWNEEYHLLDGTLQIDENEMTSGDYYFSEPGSRHTHIHSRTGSTCFVVTSTGDMLG